MAKRRKPIHATSGENSIGESSQSLAETLLAIDESCVNECSGSFAGGLFVVIFEQCRLGVLADPALERGVIFLEQDSSESAEK